jgi:hypothetical protein
VKIPTVEVHVSNIHARESFRHHSYTAMAAFASLCGFGIDGYRLAISGLAAKIGAKIVRHGRAITFQMAEVMVPRALFQQILDAIAALRPDTQRRC